MPGHLVETSLFTDVADVIPRREHPLADWAELTPHDLADGQWIPTFDSTVCR
ncbi:MULTISPECIES: hypothetical protein [unclassified Agromyces]|uniref:hypothetical protein n=1 Tax=unclassified Agromyces TaxID=2639701 RepID=UPI00301471F9